MLTDRKTLKSENGPLISSHNCGMYTIYTICMILLLCIILFILNFNLKTKTPKIKNLILIFVWKKNSFIFTTLKSFLSTIIVLSDLALLNKDKI